jgi:hypothetical protein
MRLRFEVPTFTVFRRAGKVEVEVPTFTVVPVGREG